ncbi:flagellar biosynthetic protein FliR [Undibacterium sp. TS12]|uniref:flagellar biosynthetic protein FliR n=1 Tax=Undibacterium sp. TS12 TaxID=2908202 RepID=UPI001F4C85F9|nr:flagellar biosynthetic protein FliR [Undibacterium sp. TS12]MCH8618766.1 flagellar biosynthetic protein FliR [Undibacterium sp. TS12]
MIFTATVSWVTAVLLCSMRLSALLLMTPLWQALGLPVRIRVILIAMLAFSLVSGMQLVPAHVPTDLFGLVMSGLGEVVLGALMAFGIFVAFAAFSLAGNLLDLQIGFNIANIFDPTTRSHSPLIAALFGMVALALFFTMDVHHTLLRGLAFSFEKIPLGQMLELPQPMLLARQFGTVFSYGLMLAAPAFFCLFLVEICLAVVSRNLPQLNIFMLSVPIKIVVGLSVLAYFSGHFASVATKVFGAMFGYWEDIL